MKPNYLTSGNMPEPANSVPDGGAIDDEANPADASQDAAIESAEGAQDIDETPNVSPVEQDQYDAVVEAGRSMIVAKTAQDAIMAKLKNSPNQVGKTIGHTLAMIALTVRRAGKSQGTTIEFDLLEQAGREWLGDLLEISEAMRLSTEANRDKIIDQAYAMALPTFGEALIKEGDITPEDSNLAREHLSELLPDKGGETADPAATMNDAATTEPMGA